MNAMLSNRRAWLALVVVAGLGGVAYWQREPVLAWYYVRQLTLAYPENCEVQIGCQAEPTSDPSSQPDGAADAELPAQRTALSDHLDGRERVDGDALAPN